MVNENIKIRVQIGTVSHPQIYVRATVHNDPNERSKIASACGQTPTNGSMWIRVSSAATQEDLDVVFKQITQHTLSESKAAGKTHEYQTGGDRWIQIKLDDIADGDFSKSISPMLSGSNISGHLEFAFESDTTSSELQVIKKSGRTLAYGLLESLRIQLVTNLNHDQLIAITKVVEKTTGFSSKQYESFFGNLNFNSRLISCRRARDRLLPQHPSRS